MLNAPYVNSYDQTVLLSVKQLIIVFIRNVFFKWENVCLYVTSLSYLRRLELCLLYKLPSLGSVGLQLGTPLSPV